MLDENVQVIDTDANHWKRLIELFSNRPKSEPPSILFLMVEDGICLKALHSKKGAILGFDYSTTDLSRIAKRTGLRPEDL